MQQKPFGVLFCMQRHVCDRPCRFRAASTVSPVGTSHADTNHYLAIP